MGWEEKRQKEKKSGALGIKWLWRGVIGAPTCQETLSHLSISLETQSINLYTFFFYPVDKNKTHVQIFLPKDLRLSYQIDLLTYQIFFL